MYLLNSLGSILARCHLRRVHIPNQVTTNSQIGYPFYTPWLTAVMRIKCLDEGQKYWTMVGFWPRSSWRDSNVHFNILRHLHNSENGMFFNKQILLLLRMTPKNNVWNFKYWFYVQFAATPHNPIEGAPGAPLWEVSRHIPDNTEPWGVPTGVGRGRRTGHVS